MTKTKKPRGRMKRVAARVIHELGGPSSVAEKCDVTPWGASKWQHRIPATRVLELEALLAGAGKLNHTNDRHAMRPDIYPR